MLLKLNEGCMLPHSSPFPYTLCVFNGAKWVFRLSDSLPRKIVKKAAVMIKVELGLESGVWLGLVFELVLRYILVSVLYLWLFYLATARQHYIHNVN